MHSAQPLDILFEEAGASLGRIERELRLKDEARAARFEARLAAIELAAFKAEEDRQRKFEARMAELRDGKDGEPGRDGKDADVSDLVEKVQEAVDLSAVHLGQLNRELTEKVNQKLAEVKDGKDGEPGRDGKDADIGPIRDEFEELLLAEEALSNRIEAKLAEVKDGKDGEPGKDADVEPILEEVDRKFSNIDENVKMLGRGLIDQVNTKLAEVKDGKDGKPGKDADMEFLKKEIQDDIDGLASQFHKSFDGLESALIKKVESKLAEVKDGKDGKDGEQGLPGKDGKDGQDGKMPISRIWTRDTVYYEGEVVRHAGSAYQALANTGTEPPGGHWGELASRGTDGRGFALRGTYDASAEYRQHDVVMINRNSFAAKYDNPGECPGDGWTLFAASGQRGKEGPPGSPGAKGADGRIVSITKWEADPDAMVLRMTDSTGENSWVDLEPIAVRILEAARAEAKVVR